MITYTRDQWLDRGKELYGENMKKWMFRCPSCGHVQCGEDFISLKDGPDKASNVVYFSCIGRWDGHMDTPMLTDKSPCNYTCGGLFNIGETTVTLPGDEDSMTIFSFEGDPVEVRA